MSVCFNLPAGRPIPQGRWVEDVEFLDEELASGQASALTSEAQIRVLGDTAEPITSLQRRSIGLIRPAALALWQHDSNRYGYRYRATLLDYTGDRLSDLRVTSEWFVPWLQTSIGNGQLELPSLLRHLGASEAFVAVSWGTPYQGVVYSFPAVPSFA